MVGLLVGKAWRPGPASRSPTVGAVPTTRMPPSAPMTQPAMLSRTSGWSSTAATSMTPVTGLMISYPWERWDRHDRLVSASKERRAAVRAHHGGYRWELLTCARRGHVTYAPEDAALADRLSGTTGVGEVWRCLRCGEFVVGAPHGRGPGDDAPLVLRGRALRQAIIVRALAVERWFRALLISLAAWAVWKFRGAQGSIQATVERVGDVAARDSCF